jgi:chromosomal replication initiation ATPase DnaA
MAYVQTTTSTVRTAAAGATLARLMTSLQVLGGTRLTRLTVRLILALTLDELDVASRGWKEARGANGRQGLTKTVARAGQLAAWLAHRHTGDSIAGIGRQLGRDHTTVLHALRRMPKILATESEIARAAERLEERIDRLAALPANSAEARALLPRSGK